MNIGRKITSLVGGLAALAVLMPVTPANAEPVPPFIPADSPWLTVVNYQRAMAGLSPVSEEPSFSDGAQKHSCYMLLNGMSHDEIPGRPGYTPEGDLAGNNGNVAVSSAFGTSARSHIELWMTGPFHAIGVLRPNLQRVGFGKCDNQLTSPWRSGATLDVLRGLGPRQPMAAPILWPGNGTTTNLDRFVAESPDPRSFCGWQGGGGLPVIALMPEAVNAVSGSMTGPNGPLEVCTLSRLNTSGVAQSIMAGDNAVVVMPRWRLDPGTYTVNVTTQARTVTWSFTIDPAARDAKPAPLPTTTPVGGKVGYQPVSPERIVDTREGLGGGRLPAREIRRIQVTGNLVPANATAVAVNATVVLPAGPGFLTLWDCSGTVPVVSNLNYGTWETVPNAATVSLDAQGGICAYSLLDTDLVLDVQGFYAPQANSRFTAVTPTRILETRIPYGGSGGLPAQNTMALQIRGTGLVSPDATAAVLNVTSVYPFGDGFVTVWPCDRPRPTASNLNPVSGRVRPNLVVAPIAPDGTACLYTLTDVDLVVDLTGYMAPTSALTFQAATSFRLADTRDALRPEMHLGQAGQRLNRDQMIVIQVAGVRGIAADAKAVAVNITTVDSLAGGFVTAWPCGVRPTASTGNFAGSAAVANSAHLQLSAAGQLCIYTSQPTHLIIDVTGWWS